jgi:hypothetical protein
MGQEFEVIDCQRHRIRLSDGQKYYVTIGDSYIMAHYPNSAAYDRAGEYHALNAVCRLASKLRSRGVTWGQIAYQIKSAGVGHSTVLSELVKVITDYVHTEDYVRINQDWTEPGIVDEQNTTP